MENLTPGNVTHTCCTLLLPQELSLFLVEDVNLMEEVPKNKDYCVLDRKQYAIVVLAEVPEEDHVTKSGDDETLDLCF